MSWKGFFLGLIGIIVAGGVAVFGILAWMQTESMDIWDYLGF